MLKLLFIIPRSFSPRPKKGLPGRHRTTLDPSNNNSSNANSTDNSNDRHFQQSTRRLGVLLHRQTSEAPGLPSVLSLEVSEA